MTAFRLHIAIMPTLTIRNLPDPVYKILKRQAARNHRSLNQEVVASLEQAVTPARAQAAWREAVRRIDALRAGTTDFASGADIGRMIAEGRK